MHPDLVQEDMGLVMSWGVGHPNLFKNAFGVKIHIWLLSSAQYETYECPL
jgi:hypothetical protein